MTLEAFFSNFDYIAAAPNGVKKLRELILQLAVRGKLVPQDPADEPASKLLDRIQEEKARLVKEKKIRKIDSLPEVTQNGIPFELPLGWKWTRLGELRLTIEYGTSQKAHRIQRGVPILRMNNVVAGKVIMDNLKYVDNDIEDLPKLYLNKHDLLFNRTNSFELVGKTGIFIGNNNEYTFASYLIRIALFLDYTDAYFINFCMNSDYFRRTQIEPEITQQCGQANFNGTKLANTLIPFAPLAEQHRIVAKVDQLMSLCDDLESKQEKQRQKLTRLNNAALDRLLTAQEQAEFDVAWELIRNNFDLLYATHGTIGKLRQAILQLAVQGKLVPQDPADEPASKLLDRIQEEKARLVEDKKIRRTDQLTPINSRDEPYGVPQGWAWTYLGEISNTIHYGYSASADHNIKDVRLLRITDIQNNHVNWETVPGCEISIDTVNSYTLNNGDLLIARTGGTIGKTYLVENINVCAVFASYLIRVVPNQFSLPTYFKLFAETPLYWQQLYEKSMGTGQPNVNGISLSQLLLPLPPLAEQHRIVAKVDLLMSLCDDLEARLVKGQAMAEKLTHAAVSTILKE